MVNVVVEFAAWKVASVSRIKDPPILCSSVPFDVQIASAYSCTVPSYAAPAPPPESVTLPPGSNSLFVQTRSFVSEGNVSVSGEPATAVNKTSPSGSSDESNDVMSEIVSGSVLSCRTISLFSYRSKLLILETESLVTVIAFEA